MNDEWQVPAYSLPLPAELMSVEVLTTDMAMIVTRLVVYINRVCLSFTGHIEEIPESTRKLVSLLTNL